MIRLFLRRTVHGGVRRRRRPLPAPREHSPCAQVYNGSHATAHRRFFSAQIPDDFELAHLPPHATISLPSSGGGQVKWAVEVGSTVKKGQALCEENGVNILSPADGVLAWSIPQKGEVSGDGFTSVVPTTTGAHAPLAIIVPRAEDALPFQWFSPCSDDTRELVYEGSFGALIRRVKMVSVTSCGLTLITMPLLALFGDASVAN